jgi:hypothetical protein
MEVEVSTFPAAAEKEAREAARIAQKEPVF